MRYLVMERDLNVCQYCGGDAHIAEHVLPRLSGGPTQPFNLVASCRRCNLIKRRAVWVPKNINVLDGIKPGWKNTILPLSTNDQYPLTCTLSVKFRKEELEQIREKAKKAGMKMSEWARVRLLEEVSKMEVGE